ncbi:MAG: ABC transporter permease [Ancrocorticia sp.]|uniref:ABC transporter permease n=1 Tax=Ancrocorticia sp. TaxID=2593684 RepID=UPI003F915A51
MMLNYNRRSVRFLIPLATIFLLVALWQLASITDIIPTRFAPAPTQIVSELARLVAASELWVAIGSTLTAWIQALAIAVVGGSTVGLILGSSRYLSAFFRPAIEFLKPIPSIAMIPLVILTMGSGKSSEVFLATYAAIFQMLMSAISAVRDVDPVARDTAAAYSMPLWARIRFLIIPSMLPQLLTGIRISSNTALILCITSELLVGMNGLGNQLGQARSVGNLPVMYAYILVIGIVGFGLNTLLMALQRRLLSWHESYRNEAR